MGVKAIRPDRTIHGVRPPLPADHRPLLTRLQRADDTAERAIATDAGENQARLEINARLPWTTALEILRMLKDREAADCEPEPAVLQIAGGEGALSSARRA